MVSKSTLIGIALLVSALAVAGYRLTSTDEGGGAKRQGGAKSAIAVRVEPVQQGTIESSQVFSGSVEASAKLELSSELRGQVRRLHFDLGDRIARGALVAELDDERFVHAHKEARARLAVARAQLRAAKGAKKIADDNRQRVAKLQKRGVASQEELARLTARVEATAAEVDIARAALERESASLELAKLNLARTKIYANWDGDDESRVVAQRHVDSGQLIEAHAVLFSIVDIDPIQISIHATEKDYAALAPGQAVELETDAYPGQVFMANVARLSPVFRADSRQARIELEAQNPEHRLKPGMFVRARAVLDRVAAATLIPERALLSEDGRSYVYALSGSGERDVAGRVEVKLGLRDGERVQVLASELKPGQRIVTLGQANLKPGSAVVVVAPTPAEFDTAGAKAQNEQAEGRSP